MKAALTTKAGAPSVIEIREVARPVVKPGWVLKDSLKCIGYKGIVCMTGILGNEWTMQNFTPMGGSRFHP